MGKRKAREEKLRRERKKNHVPNPGSGHVWMTNPPPPLAEMRILREVMLPLILPGLIAVTGEKKPPEPDIVDKVMEEIQ